MRSPATAYDLRAALSEELRAAITELDAAIAGPKAVHRCRVRIKRARALARVGKACAPGLADLFNNSASAAMLALAHARDAAALAECARMVAAKARGKDAAALLALAEALDSGGGPPLAPNLHAARAGLRDLLALALVWPEASVRQISQGAARIARRAKQARQRGRKCGDPMLRHEWRKREKDRFYAVSLLGEAWPREYKRRRKLGEALGESLGAERDVRLLVDRLEAASLTTGSAKTDKRALRVLEQRLERLSGKADKLGAALHAGGA